MQRVRLWYPFLFLVWALLAAAAANLRQFSAATILLGSIVAFVILGSSIALVLLKSRTREAAAVACSGAIVALFVYGPIQAALTQWQPNANGFNRYRIKASVIVLLTTCTLGWILRRQERVERASRQLQRLAGVLVVIGLIAITYEMVQSSVKQPVASNDELRGSRTDRNIYFILLDGYANEAVLREIYGFANDNFTRFLKQSGFFVSDDATSNYAMTLLSLAATLNYAYLDDAVRFLDRDSTDATIPKELVRQSRVVASLRARGYRTVSVSTGWELTNRLPGIDERIACGGWRSYVSEVAATTLISPLFSQFTILTSSIRRRVLCQFNTLSSWTPGEVPTWMFVHILSPHPPFVFGSHGEPLADRVPENSSAGWKDKSRYVEQLRFVTTMVEKTIYHLIAVDPTAVIIVQSDHGPAASGDWNAPTDEFIRERMRIFSAMRLPGLVTSAPARDMSAVNTFPIVFNAYFDARLPILENRAYFSTYEAPYAFRDVAEIVKAGLPSQKSVSLE